MFNITLYPNPYSHQIEVDDSTEGKQGLMKVMEDIRDVKRASELNAEIFEPLKEMLAVLKTHGTDITQLPQIGLTINLYPQIPSTIS